MEHVRHSADGGDIEGEYDIEIPRLTGKRPLPCPLCKYNLSGLELPANCPECGEHWTRTKLGTRSRRSWRIGEWIERQCRRAPIATPIAMLLLFPILTYEMSQIGGPTAFHVLGLTALILVLTPVSLIRTPLCAFMWWVAEHDWPRPSWSQVARWAVGPVLIAGLWGFLLTGLPRIVSVELSRQPIRERASASSTVNPTISSTEERVGALNGRWVQLGPGVGGLAFEHDAYLGSVQMLVYSPDSPPIPTAAHLAWYEEHGKWPEHLEPIMDQRVWPSPKQNQVGFYELPLMPWHFYEPMFDDPSTWQ